MRRRERPEGTTIEVRTAPLPDGGHISAVTDGIRFTQAGGPVMIEAGLTPETACTPHVGPHTPVNGLVVNAGQAYHLSGYKH